MPDATLNQLQTRLGYHFTTLALLEEAVTHISFNPEGKSYQRLEFLGDRVLGVVVSTMLFEAFPHAPEGELSQRLADLVRKESCAEVARGWNLGDFLRLGQGERRSGAKKRDAMLGDACEAVIGAVYRDGGIEAATALIRRAWEGRMNAPLAVPRDAKTALQEAVQARGLPVPIYETAFRSGPDHAPHFKVAVKVAGLADALGEGTSKRHAERAAAEAFLRREGLWT